MVPELAGEFSQVFWFKIKKEGPEREIHAPRIRPEDFLQKSSECLVLEGRIPASVNQSSVEIERHPEIQLNPPHQTNSVNQSLKVHFHSAN